MLLRPLYIFPALAVSQQWTHLRIIYTNWLLGPYTPIFMAGDTLLLAFLPATLLYRHYIRKDRPLAVSELDIASRILKARVLATIGEQPATIYCPSLTDRMEQPIRLQTAFTPCFQRRTLRLANS